MAKLYSLLVVLTLSGCQTQNIAPIRPAIDLSPLGCGQKWIQSGYSEYVAFSCTEDRSGLKETLMADATAKAWKNARTRCPASCSPRELNDPSDWKNPAANGICRENYVYFATRVFFQCG